MGGGRPACPQGFRLPLTHQVIVIAAATAVRRLAPGGQEGDRPPGDGTAIKKQTAETAAGETARATSKERGQTLAHDIGLSRQCLEGIASETAAYGGVLRQLDECDDKRGDG